MIETKPLSIVCLDGNTKRFNWAIATQTAYPKEPSRFLRLCPSASAARVLGLPSSPKSFVLSLRVIGFTFNLPTEKHIQSKIQQ